MSTPKTVEEYLSKVEPVGRQKLKELRRILQVLAPDATESVKWGALAFSYKRILFTYAAFKNHIGFYPTPRVIKAFSKQLSKKGFDKKFIIKLFISNPFMCPSP